MYCSSLFDQVFNQCDYNFSYYDNIKSHHASSSSSGELIIKLIVAYDVNTRFLLILSGDVETHPGPEDPEDLSQCPCDETLFCKSIKCVKCTQQYHILCVGLDGITNAALEKLRNWYCPLCLVLPDKIKKKMVEKFELQSDTNNDLDKILRNIKEAEKNIIDKIDNKSKEVIQGESPYLASAMKKLEKQVNENNKLVKNQIENSEENKQAKEKEIKLTRIVIKPIDRNIKNSRDLREEFRKSFPDIHPDLARISAGGSFVFKFKTEQDAEEVQSKWNKDLFGGNSGIIKINDRNKVGIVKFAYCTGYDENEIIEEIENNYPGVKPELFKKDGQYTGMIKVTFKDETELQAAITNKFNIFNRKYITEMFISKPRVIKCNICQLFGHVSRRCRNQDKPVCGKCSTEGHETKDCKANENELKCYHCNKNDHTTGSYKCEKTQEKLQVLKDRRDNGQ